MFLQGAVSDIDRFVEFLFGIGCELSNKFVPILIKCFKLLKLITVELVDCLLSLSLYF